MKHLDKHFILIGVGLLMVLPIQTYFQFKIPEPSIFDLIHSIGIWLIIWGTIGDALHGLKISKETHITFEEGTGIIKKIIKDKDE